MVRAAQNALLPRVTALRQTVALTICHSDLELTPIILDEPPSLQFTEIFSGNSLLYVVITIALLLLTSIISLCESAYFSLDAEEVEEIRKGKTRQTKSVAALLSNAQLLITVLTTWKYLLLILSIIMFSFSQFSTKPSGLVGQVITLTLVFSIFGIGLPKLYGSQRRLSIVKTFTGLSSVLVKITSPFVKGLLRLAAKLDKQLEEMAEENSVKELTQVLELAAADKDTTEDEKEILRGIVNFGTLTVDDVMRPQAEINHIDSSLNFHDLLIYIKKSGYSRIPVYHESLEKIDGILYIKDLLPYLNETKKFAWQKLLRPAYFVSENKKIDLLLKEFQEKRVHMALALNGQGQISGIITLEDIIEEIIGDIHDEFDEVGAYYKKVDDKTFIVDSKIPLSEFCRILDVDPSVFAVENSENDALGTVLAEIQTELPKKGDQIILDPFTLIIEAVDHKRIKKIKVHLHEQKEK
jgi:putative hemolysin